MKTFQFFSASAGKIKDTVPPEKPISLVTDQIAEDQNVIEERETRLLYELRKHAESLDAIIINSSEIHEVIQGLGSISKIDLDWNSSPCYPSPYIAVFKRITVIPGAKLLLNEEGTALSDEICLGFRQFGLRPKLWDMDVLSGPSLRFKLPPLSRKISSGIHITGEHEANYFHWIVEVLPRLYLCEKFLPDKRIPILISEGLNDNLYVLLDIIRAPERSVLKLQQDHTYFVEQLIYPSDLSRILDVYDRPPGMDTTYLPVNLLKEMAATIKRAFNPTTDHPKRLFIRRTSTYRRLLNEAEIETILTKVGFFPIDPGRMTIEEQVCIFAQAEFIIGPSGASMANMLWCGPKVNIIILHSDHPFKKYPYWDALARVSGSQVYYLAGPRAHNVSGTFEAHDDYSINPGTLVSLLKGFNL